MSAAQEVAPRESPSTGVRIDASRAEGGVPGILLIQTTPESIRFHLVEDYELEMLMNFSLPLSFGICMASLGAFLGFTPEAVRIILQAREASLVSLEDLLTALIWVSCLVTSVITGTLVTSGFRKTRAALNDIRSRPANPLSVGSRPMELVDSAHQPPAEKGC